MLIFKKGDLFEAVTPIAHCISADVVMAKGVALQVRKKFGHIKDIRQQVDRIPKCNQVGQIAVVKCQHKVIFHLITKPTFNSKPTLRSVQSALICLRDYMVHYQITTVAMPAIASGLDKMVWKDIEYLLRQIFDDCNILVTVYIL